MRGVVIVVSSLFEVGPKTNAQNVKGDDGVENVKVFYAKSSISLSAAIT